MVKDTGTRKDTGVGKNIVIGIDSSTTATKAVAWNHEGYPLAEGRSMVPLSHPKPGWYEQNPEDWWQSTCEALQQLWQRVSPERVAALAIANQRETVVPLDQKGNALRPAILWLDERCFDEVTWLSNKVGKDKLHHVTGRPPDVTTAVYSLAWMLRRENKLYKQADKFVEVHGYLVSKLTGELKTSWASADPMGVFDIHTYQYSRDILNALELTPQHFAEAYEPSTLLGEVTAVAANATGLKQGTPIVAGGGDGQAAGLGLNSTFAERAYLNLGTAVVSGIYSSQAHITPACRTLIACNDGYILETLLRSGTFLLTWFVDTFLDGNAAWERLEHEAKSVPIGSEGLLLVPHFSGCMTPYWDGGARGVILGLSAAHKRPQLYRALLEGITLEQVMMTQGVEGFSNKKINEYVLTGGGANNKLWSQMVADVSGKQVVYPHSTEATNLGAGMLAAVAAGWYKTVNDAAAHMSHVVGALEPNVENHQRYQALLNIYQDVYPQVNSINQKLGAFRTGQKP
jgi:sugar (pentulose or hexulose) kinase